MKNILYPRQMTSEGPHTTILYNATIRGDLNSTTALNVTSAATSIPLGHSTNFTTSLIKNNQTGGTNQ